MKSDAVRDLGVALFDAASYLQSEDDCAMYLTVAMQEGDPALLAAALGDVARARGMSSVARDAGLTREGLYKALNEQGNPSLATVMKVMRAVGLQFTVQPLTQA